MSTSSLLPLPRGQPRETGAQQQPGGGLGNRTRTRNIDVIEVDRRRHRRSIRYHLEKQVIDLDIRLRNIDRGEATRGCAYRTAIGVLRHTLQRSDVEAVAWSTVTG